MISEKRILAARANGARSRGPKTPEGKARSRNAVRSRRLTDCTVLATESREGFQSLFNFHVACFSPLDEVEMGMVEEMASAYWRIRRNWTIENYLLESAAARQPEGAAVPRIADAHAEVSANPQYAILRRDETRLHLMYQRALYNLLFLKNAKNREEPRKSCVSNISSDLQEPNEPEQPNEPDLAAA
jgi:hypothetical protein